jgi:hypothetical protein
MLTRRAVGVDDLARQQIPDSLSVFWLIGGKDIVEAAIFGDDIDDMLDRRFRGLSLLRPFLLLVRGESALQVVRQRCAETDERYQGDACDEPELDGPINEAGERHCLAFFSTRTGKRKQALMGRDDRPA